VVLDKYLLMMMKRWLSLSAIGMGKQGIQLRRRHGLEKRASFGV
jgi:hypothetical protein